MGKKTNIVPTNWRSLGQLGLVIFPEFAWKQMKEPKLELLSSCMLSLLHSRQKCFTLRFPVWSQRMSAPPYSFFFCLTFQRQEHLSRPCLQMIDPFYYSLYDKCIWNTNISTKNIKQNKNRCSFINTQ